MNAIKEWFDGREAREQYLILVCTAVIVLFLINSIIWQPISSQFSETETRLNELRNDVAWMRKTSPQILALRPANAKPRPNANGQSLQTLINLSASSAKLSDVIKYTIPKGDSKFQIRLEDAKFNHIVNWIDAIRMQYAISVYYIDIHKTNNQGQVNSNITLNRLP